MSKQTNTTTTEAAAAAMDAAAAAKTTTAGAAAAAGPAETVAADTTTDAGAFAQVVHYVRRFIADSPHSTSRECGQLLLDIKHYIEENGRTHTPRNRHTHEVAVAAMAARVSGKYSDTNPFAHYPEIAQDPFVAEVISGVRTFLRLHGFDGIVDRPIHLPGGKVVRVCKQPTHFNDNDKADNPAERRSIVLVDVPTGFDQRVTQASVSELGFRGRFGNHRPTTYILGTPKASMSRTTILSISFVTQQSGNGYHLMDSDCVKRVMFVPPEQPVLVGAAKKGKKYNLYAAMENMCARIAAGDISPTVFAKVSTDLRNWLAYIESDKAYAISDCVVPNDNPWQCPTCEKPTSYTPEQQLNFDGTEEYRLCTCATDRDAVEREGVPNLCAVCYRSVDPDHDVQCEQDCDCGDHFCAVCIPARTCATCADVMCTYLLPPGPDGSSDPLTCTACQKAYDKRVLALFRAQSQTRSDPAAE